MGWILREWPAAQLSLRLSHDLDFEYADSPGQMPLAALDQRPRKNHGSSTTLFAFFILTLPKRSGIFLGVTVPRFLLLPQPQQLLSVKSAQA